jgi:hypothetical protein
MKKKIVILRLTGRCGNQLFQYCYGRSVALDNNADLWVYGNCNVDSAWKNDLPGFNVVCQFKSGNPYSFLNKVRFTIGARRLERSKSRDKLIAYYRKHGIFFTYYSLPPKVAIKAKIIYLIPVGDNERHDLIDKNREIILQEITAKEPIPYGDIFTPEVQIRETVCVSVRRGDFLSDKYKPFISFAEKPISNGRSSKQKSSSKILYSLFSRTISNGASNRVSSPKALFTKSPVTPSPRN